MSELETVLLEIDSDLSRLRRQIANVPLETSQAVDGAVRSIVALNNEIGNTKTLLVDVNREVASLTNRNLDSTESADDSDVPSMDSIRSGESALIETSVLGPVINAIRRVFRLILEFIGAVELATDAYSMLSKTSETTADKFEEFNRHADMQIRKLREAKGLVDTVSEAEGAIRKSLGQLTLMLEKLEGRRSVVREQISALDKEGTKSISLGGEAVPLDEKTERDLLSRQMIIVVESVEILERIIAKFSEALKEQPAENRPLPPEEFNDLFDCLELICDRLESFGQDLPFDRASGGSVDPELTPAAFAGAPNLPPPVPPEPEPLPGLGLEGFHEQVEALAPGLAALSAQIGAATAAAEDFRLALSQAFDDSGLAQEPARSAAALGAETAALEDGTAAYEAYGRARLVPDNAPLLDNGLMAFRAEHRELLQLNEDYSTLARNKGAALIQSQGLIEAEDALAGAANRAGTSLAYAFERAVFGGQSLHDTLTGLARELSRLGFSSFVTGPLQRLIGGAFGATSGTAGPSTFARLTQIAAADVSNPLLAEIFHGGGVAGQGTLRCAVAARAFETAQRFAEGGPVGFRHDEIPAVLHRGEVVRTPAQEAALGRRLGRDGDTVNIHVSVPPGTAHPNAFGRSVGQAAAEAFRAAQRASRRNN